jgi:hypothetical protein
MVWQVLAKAAVGLIGSKLAGRDAKKSSTAATNATQLQTQIEQDKWNRYQEIYEPLERKFVADAQSADTPERYKTAAADASATVSSQFGQARRRLARQPGADPSTAGYQANMAGLDLAQAATGAVAQNEARRQVEDTALARQQTAISLGRGLDSSAAAGLGTVGRTNAGIAELRFARGRQDAESIGAVGEQIVTAGSDWLKNRRNEKNVNMMLGL